MRVLFTTIPGSGHFNPIVPTALALRARGHEVTFANSAAHTPAIEAAGFSNIPAGPSWLESMADPVMQEILRKEFFTELIRMGMVEGLVRAARTTEAEALVAEGGQVAGRVAAAILDIPYIDHAPAAAKMWWPIIRDGVGRAAGEHGVDGQRVTADDYAALNIDRTPATMETPGHVPAPNLVNVRPVPYEGPAAMPEGADDLGTARPLVFVTLGTVFNGMIPLFQHVATALGGEDVDVLLVTGRGVSRNALGALPENVRVAGYVPQTELVRRAAAVISHGGYNTVISALAAGVPQYVIPIGADQPYNGERVATAGAGISEPAPAGWPQAAPGAFTPPAPGRIVDSVRRLLGEPGFAAAARRVAAEIAAMPPVAAAATAIEAAVRDRAAVSA